MYLLKEFVKFLKENFCVISMIKIDLTLNNNFSWTDDKNLTSLKLNQTLKSIKICGIGKSQKQPCPFTDNLVNMTNYIVSFMTQNPNVCCLLFVLNS